jgi:hypothetical protein
MSTEPTYADRTRTEPTTETRTTPSGSDPWAADTAEQRISPLAAPFTFDPYSTRRLRNTTDDANAAMPNADGSEE